MSPSNRKVLTAPCNPNGRTRGKAGFLREPRRRCASRAGPCPRACALPSASSAAARQSLQSVGTASTARVPAEACHLQPLTTGAPCRSPDAAAPCRSLLQHLISRLKASEPHWLLGGRPGARAGGCPLPTVPCFPTASPRRLEQVAAFTPCAPRGGASPCPPSRWRWRCFLRRRRRRLSPNPPSALLEIGRWRWQRRQRHPQQRQNRARSPAH